MINYINKLHSFDDFYTALKPLKPKQKGDLFEELTKYILLYHPDYQYITKEVWMLNEIPLTLLKKFNMPSKDQGIDLVLRTHQGKYYAIQCKFRMNVDEIITWTELATFFGLAFGVAQGFSGGLYVTNTADITANAKASNIVVPLYGDFFETLSDDFFRVVESKLIPTIKFKPIPLVPRDYQKEMIHETMKYFTEYDRGIIESACGTGKTLTTYWIHKKLMSNLTIVAVPSLFLLSQFYKDWTKQMSLEGTRSNYILVGSQADSGDTAYENNGLLITTDPDELTGRIHSVIKGGLIIITTYQSSDKLILALTRLNIEPNLCIFDEAHKTVGQTNAQFSLLLDDDNIKIRKRLFVTATPKIYNGNVDDDNMLSMDNETWYGKTIYTYNTSNAIKDGFLSDYQLVTMYTDDVYIQDMIKQNNYLWYDVKLIDSQYMASAIMIMNQFKKNDCTHMVTYHNSVLGAKRFQQILEKLNEDYKLELSILDVNGTHSVKLRTKIFKEFTDNKLSILVSARVLNEGINIPIIDSVCFVDPRVSTIDIIQCAGRALRLYDGKIMAKIYVPIILSDIENIEDDKVFGNLIRLLKCLSETDDGVKAYFSASANGVICDRKLIRHDTWLSADKMGKIVNIEEWINSIDVKVWNKVDHWQYIYNQLLQWVHINKKIPRDHVTEKIESNLNSFCNNQRQNKKNNSLSIQRTEKLEKIVGWFWSMDETFDKTYDELVDWIAINNCIPSQKSKDKSERSLGTFCCHHRQNKKNNIMSNERIRKFENINGWYWGLDDIFDNTYDELVSWISKNSKLPSTTSKDPNERKLATFCGNIKKRKHQNKLSDDRIKKLELINIWRWSSDEVRTHKTFEENYSELTKWISQNGYLPKRDSLNETEKRLNVWCVRMRGKKRLGKLSENEINRLELINGWFWGNENERIKKSFDQNCEEVKEWISTHKKMPNNKSEQKHEKDIGNFCANQKKYRKEGKLTNEQIAKLESLPGWTWKRTY